MKTNEALPEESLFRDILSRALKGGAEQAEVYARAARGLSVDAKDRQVEAIETKHSIGYCVRVIKQGRLGFSYSSDFAEHADVVARALACADYPDADPANVLPNPQGQPACPDIHDPLVAQISEQHAIDLALSIEEAALAADKRVTKIRKASASFGSGETLIINSNGLSHRYASTGASAQIMAVAQDGTDSRMSWEMQGSRHMEHVDFADVGRRAAQRAAQLLGARTISTARVPVYLDSQVACDFLSVFASMLSAEAVQKGKSLLKGKLGERIIAPMLDIVDNGLLDKAPGTRPVDDEGVHTRANTLVRQGVLEGYMYNTYRAMKEGRASTGNGIRAGHASAPYISPHNLIIKASAPGSNFEQTIANMSRGLYITDAMGMHTANPVSGEFSVGVAGLWIEGGEVRHPVKEAVMTANILEMFSLIRAVDDDMRFYGGISSPGLVIEGMDISA